MPDIQDPMLAAAAEGIASPDHLRRLGYADQELASLRTRLGLSTPTGYAGGAPVYAPVASAWARQTVAEVERRAGGRFSPDDRRAIAEVLDEVNAAHVASAA